MILIVKNEVRIAVTYASYICVQNDTEQLYTYLQTANLVPESEVCQHLSGYATEASINLNEEMLHNSELDKNWILVKYILVPIHLGENN